VKYIRKDERITLINRKKENSRDKWFYKKNCKSNDQFSKI